MTIKKFISAVLLLIAAVPVFAGTYYISPDGNDTSGDGTSAAPWKTSTKAFTVARGGDTVIWKDGTYTHSGGNISNPVSGSAGSYLVLKAESDGGAILKGYSEAITLDQRSYIQIEGFTIKDGNGSHAVYVTDSHHIKFFRLGIKNGVRWNAQYGNVFELSGQNGTGTKDCLLEDVWISGAMRYGILLGGTAGFTERNVLRRCVVRFDGGGSPEPHAGISNYGATSGIDGARNNVLQNCITIDFNAADGSGEGVYAGFYNPHASTNIDYYGCIALKTRERGWLLNEDAGSNGNDMFNCIVWAPTNDAIAGQRSQSGGSTIEQVTVGAAGGSGIISYNGAVATVRNCLFYGNAGGNSGSLTQEFNHFWNNTVSGTNALSSNPSLKYITQIETNSTAYQSGKNGATRGATVLKRYGTSGTLHGESGYDTLTADDLWPFPYQQRIKDLFAEADGNSNMPNNNEQRGFAASGMTLTKYIWEFLGVSDPNPSDTTDTVRPTIISATAASATSISILFSEAMETASAQTSGNYAISNSLSVRSAALSGDNRTVVLQVDPLLSGMSYTVTMSNLNDRASPANTILTNSAVTLTYSASTASTGAGGAGVSPDGLKPGQQTLGTDGTIAFGGDAQQIVVHDARGNVIYRGSKSGNSAIVWNGTDKDGRSVRSGMYTSKILGADGRVVYFPIMVIK